ncbi:MAG: NAD-dependent epimerase/dehydratase family protein [Candidatus Omnitrophica bacterium]|nr:NAD-dependent epimerase/dehydratase family protein [Candidatus Omnitrophota bacterium]
MKIALITGALGLIGSESVEFFAEQGFQVVGIDNDMRKYFFGSKASTSGNKERLTKKVPNYRHHNVDIRETAALEKIFKDYNKDIALIVHTAAQPSHDWAAKEPFTDFSINATGTLNLLELARTYCPETVFIFTSTNKVYGDLPNLLPLKEEATRWELSKEHEYYTGIDETMSIDQSKHSLFGASKVAADILVQEYGRYFGMKTGIFRGGCLTGPHHSGAELHGFLSYLMKCCVSGDAYTVFGYKGKQVRDNIHSYDLVSAFFHFYQNPREGEVYNIGGGRDNSCSVLEAIELCEEISGRKLTYDISEKNRAGDHMWYISSLAKFQNDYPQWKQTYTLKKTLEEIHKSAKVTK